MIKLIIICAVLCSGFTISPLSYGEYRAYQYLIRNKDLSQNPGSFLNTSTLDPVSYLAYHGGGESIVIDLVRTWMCLGHTGGNNMQICPSPEVNWQKTLGQELNNESK